MLIRLAHLPQRHIEQDFRRQYKLPSSRPTSVSLPPTILSVISFNRFHVCGPISLLGLRHALGKGGNEIFCFVTVD
jgi:hypothetical protein